MKALILSFINLVISTIRLIATIFTYAVFLYVVVAFIAGGFYGVYYGISLLVLR